MHQRYTNLQSTDLDSAKYSTTKTSTPSLWAKMPMSKSPHFTMEEVEPVVRAVRESKRIVQCRMQQRSWTHFRSAVD